jgi:Flp pilus assembly protein TadG
MMRRRRMLDKSQRGTVLLETALAFPLVILFILGSADLGLGAFDRTQAASSARDGARRGSLSYWQADIGGSSDSTAITTVIRQRLGNRSFVTEVHCVGPQDTTPLSGGCAAASVINADRIQVMVTWQGPGLAPKVSATALMSLNGLPTANAAS